MTCQLIRTPTGMIVVCARGRRPHQVCSVPGCGRDARRLCDERLANGQTCDKPLCTSHAVSIGPDQDLCPPHARARKGSAPA